MGISAFDNILTSEHKLSYETVGFPLDLDMYPDGLRLDQKRSVLRSIISKEQKKTDLRFIGKWKGWDRFLRKIRKLINDLTLGGSMSEYESLQKYYYSVCGKYGIREQDLKGDTRDIVYHCNQRKRCPVCSKRYHDGKSRERGGLAAAVLQANDLRHVRKFNLTMPDFLWPQVKGPEDWRVMFKSANKMLQGWYGCSMDRHGRYEKGSVGIHIQIHPYSSTEAWREKPHLHCYVIPLKVEKDKVENVDFYINESFLEAKRLEWAEVLRGLCRQLGWSGMERVPDDVNLWHGFIDVPRNLAGKGHPGLNFKYDQRSPVEDLESAVVGYDFKQKMVFMSFVQSDDGYYAVWSFDDYAAELLKRLKLKGTNSNYGWLTRFKSYAKALGVEVEKETDDFEAVEELEVKTAYRREYKGAWNKVKKKVVGVKSVFVRLLTDPDEPECWKEVDPWVVRGEQLWTGSKVRYKYAVGKGRAPP